MFCGHHPNYALKYFCEDVKCKTPICKECWEHDRKDENHRVILLKIHLEPQKEVQNRLAKYKSEFQGVAQFLEGELKNVLKQVENAEKKQQDVVRSKSANELESKLKETRNALESHLKNFHQLRSNFLSKTVKLEKSWDDFFGNRVENTESSLLNNGAPFFQKLISSKKKKPELVRVTQRLLKDCTEIFPVVVYNSSTKEKFSMARENRDVIVFCINDTSREIEVKRKMNWQSLRGTEGGDKHDLNAMEMDGRNTLYGVIQQRSDYMQRLEVLDQNNIAKIGQLDTCGIENGRGFIWIIGAFEDTVALAVNGLRPSGWISVTVFKNQRRQNTVSLNIFSGQIRTSLFCPTRQYCCYLLTNI